MVSLRGACAAEMRGTDMSRALCTVLGFAVVGLALASLGCASSAMGTQFQVTPASLDFGEVITSDRLDITFVAGVEDQAWYITSVAEWLRVSPMSGVGSTAVTVEVIRQDLLPDTYSTNLQVQGSADLVTIPVTMEVQ